MVFNVKTIAIAGVSGELVDVQVDANNGLPGISIVGLAGREVQESRERVISAIRNSGFRIPPKKLIINLSPAYLTKNSTYFDLPIAIAILSKFGAVNIDLKKKLFWGELALDGSLSYVNGGIAVVAKAKELGFKEIFLPEIPASEAGIVDGIKIYGSKSLLELVKGDSGIIKYSNSKIRKFKQNAQKSIFPIRSDHTQKALMLSALGNHNLLMAGPPGSGKTTLANSILEYLEEPEEEELLEILKIHNIKDGLESEKLTNCRPFRVPHHTSTLFSIVGGGNRVLPGEISLAHHGVLFLDEINEFKPNVLEALREPIETKSITLHRGGVTRMLPADFLLIGAMNPCKCGYYSQDNNLCVCSEYSRRKYLHRLSGALLDRFVINVYVDSIDNKQLFTDLQDRQVMHSQKLKSARLIRQSRMESMSREGNVGGHMSAINQLKVDRFDSKSSKELVKIANKLNFSTRGTLNLLKLSRTVADLNLRESVKKEDVFEAALYRVSSV